MNKFQLTHRYSHALKKTLCLVLKRKRDNGSFGNKGDGPYPTAERSEILDIEQTSAHESNGYNTSDKDLDADEKNHRLLAKSSIQRIPTQQSYLNFQMQTR